MSHGFRTPLNSLLILSDQLSKNPDGTLTSKQQDFAKTIHSSGNDLLMLINDILDLSKIESGRFRRTPATSDSKTSTVTSRELSGTWPIARARVPDQLRLPAAPVDVHGRQAAPADHQELLSNAFKFTHHGEVALTVEPCTGGWSNDHDELNRAAGVIHFAVTDSGIGIASDKQQIIFEAFQQADGSTNRKYGGTGLGSAISRELSRLLGGEIRLSSSPGQGSTFHLYLPIAYTPPRLIRKVPASGVSVIVEPPALEAALRTQRTARAAAQVWRGRSDRANHERIRR